MRREEDRGRERTPLGAFLLPDGRVDVLAALKGPGGHGPEEAERLARLLGYMGIASKLTEEQVLPGVVMHCLRFKVGGADVSVASGPGLGEPGTLSAFMEGRDTAPVLGLRAEDVIRLYL